MTYTTSVDALKAVTEPTTSGGTDTPGGTTDGNPGNSKGPTELANTGSPAGWLIVGGIIWVEARPRIHPQNWIALGLLAAGGAAMLVWWAAKPFLSAISLDLHLPVIGAVHLSTVLLFDIGVYMLVIGSTVLILVALAHQSLRLHRKTPVQSDPPALPLKVN